MNQRYNIIIIVKEIKGTKDAKDENRSDNQTKRI